ncbi:urease accessory protein UreF [Paraburkholderia sp. BCC1886]|uniref:urease accessory protein UreF n=1 Tax=Paraburkholderia sp. BCC1886 TaxID=2562670 RepID=UPI0011841506|nr:urease accessory UreF family protein [Paraburkholderia sp. BCC1886]
MTEFAGLLASLQQSDSFFPSGSMAFSWGLEALQQDGLVKDAASLAVFVESQALDRWAGLDQGIVCAAWRAVSLDAWFEVDAWAEAVSLPEPMRQGARRLGRTLAEVHARLDCGLARDLRAAIVSQRTPGHLPAVQGALWRSFGIDEDNARAISAHTACTGAVSAAVRLGIVGHLDAQHVLTALRAPLAAILARPAPALDESWSSTFAADIAVMRRHRHDARLFAN